MAKARCEWDELKFNLLTQKLHQFLDVLQKTAKEAFRSDAQQFKDKAIYAKMPDHVKKILNRAYLEDKPYNDIVLHLQRKLRLNGLGAPDEVTLVTLNKMETVQPKTKTKQQKVAPRTPERDFASFAINSATLKPNAKKRKVISGIKGAK